MAHDSDTGDGRALLWLMLIAAASTAAGLGLRDPWGGGEASLALAARELLDGNLHAGSHEHPPRLAVWLAAVGQWAGGSVRGGFLLVPMAAGLGMLALVWDLARRHAGRDAAIGAVLILLLSAQFALQIRSGTWVMTSGFLGTLTLYGLLRHLASGPAWAWLGIGLASALAQTSLGAPGYLPLLMALPWLVVSRRAANGLWRPQRHLRLALGGGLLTLAALLAIAGPHQPAPEGPWQWPFAWWPGLAVAWLPLTALLPWLLACWRRAESNGAFLILSAWIPVALGLIWLTPGNTLPYALGILPAAVVLAAPWLAELARERSVRRLALLLTLLVPAGLIVYSLWPPTPAQARLSAGEAFPWPFVRWAVLLGLLVPLVFRQRHALAGMTIVVLGFWMLLAGLGRPAIDGTRSARDLARLAEAVQPADRDLGLLGDDARLLLQLDRPIMAFGTGAGPAVNKPAAVAWLAANSERRLLISAKHADCFDTRSATLLGDAGDQPWYLVAATDVAADCAPVANPASGTEDAEA